MQSGCCVAVGGEYYRRVLVEVWLGANELEKKPQFDCHYVDLSLGLRFLGHHHPYDYEGDGDGGEDGYYLDEYGDWDLPLFFVGLDQGEKDNPLCVGIEDLQVGDVDGNEVDRQELLA